MIGDESFDKAFPSLARLSYQVAFRILGDRSAAEDVSQDTLARAYLRWSRIELYAEPWVVRVATNRALDVARGSARRNVGFDGTSSRRWASTPIADERRSSESFASERLDLARMLARLPRRQREVIALRYLADLSEQQVATALGCSVGSVKRHTHRAVNALRIHLTVEGGI